MGKHEGGPKEYKPHKPSEDPNLDNHGGGGGGKHESDGEDGKK